MKFDSENSHKLGLSRMNMIGVGLKVIRGIMKKKPWRN
ncbi:DsrE/DsrF/DrsH-like family protein [Paenibacillus illinoisensis]|uniref:CoA-disulfide reductase-Disulfide bond regulator n=1 Tax=Paenibacillus illinoisensis TaxID=59845 RepID=A0A2W0C6U5_9BACL|nr:DsrE/DsrF/DrsH-like family protein [Paenibacillus illinoisensis]PYY25752.1 CoA-disulfide reductase - Disulfide bond regulator [Paenibacillus illinoisensis]